MPLVDPRVSLVVPFSCGPATALACLEGIAAQGEDPSFEVIVVDNAAPGLASLLDRLDGDVEIVRCDRRLSFAAALRRGTDRARGEIVVAIRAAAVPQPGWLTALVTTLDADCALGAAASVTAGEDGTTGGVLDALAIAFRASALRETQAQMQAQTPTPLGADELALAELALDVANHGHRTRAVTGSVVAPARTERPAAELGYGQPPELTVVIPTLDATSPRLRRCLTAVAAATNVSHEVVVVDNGAPAQGFAGPVNAGIRAARTPYVVVMNDDVEPEPGWWEPLREMLDAGAPVAFPLTIEGAMREDFAAWCFAVSAEAITEFGHGPGELFDPSLVIWFQDTDLLITLQQAGRPPVLVRESRIRHGLSQTVGTKDPRLSEWVHAQIERDHRRFVIKHPEIQLSPQEPALP